MQIESIPLTGPLNHALQKPCKEPELYWLGQAGFLFRSTGLAFAIDPAIDPYLSDQLAEKYRSHDFSHERMMPAPLSFAELPDLNFVFCTHHHGDHLVAPTLEWIAANRPLTRFVAPAGIEAEITRLELPLDRVFWAEADRPITLTPHFEIIPVPAAHEEFGYDSTGRHRFLGYLFRCGPLKLYHSGDTIPADFCRWTVNQKAEPFPRALSRPILPPIFSTNCLEIARPRPVPPNFRVVDDF